MGDAKQPVRAERAAAVNIDRLAAGINDSCRSKASDWPLKIGALVVQELFGGNVSAWESDGPHCVSYRALAARGDLLQSASAVCRAVAVYAMVERLGGRSRFKRLAVSHFQEVLPLPPTEQERLLVNAQAAGWTVARLRREASALRAQKRPPPEVDKLIRAMRRLRLDVADHLRVLGPSRAPPGEREGARELLELVERLREELLLLRRALEA